MAKRTIVWTELAIRQRRNVFHYWNVRNESSKYSKWLLKEVKARLFVVANFPEIGKRTDIPDVRVLIFENYSIFYSFDDFKIKVLMFWDDRQNPIFRGGINPL